MKEYIHQADSRITCTRSHTHLHTLPLDTHILPVSWTTAVLSSLQWVKCLKNKKTGLHQQFYRTTVKLQTTLEWGCYQSVKCKYSLSIHEFMLPSSHEQTINTHTHTQHFKHLMSAYAKSNKNRMIFPCSLAPLHSVCLRVLVEQDDYGDYMLICLSYNVQERRCTVATFKIISSSFVLFVFLIPNLFSSQTQVITVIVWPGM